MISTEKREDIAPVCPHCKKEIVRIMMREMETDIPGSKRIIYFCPECHSILGISHRKGFFMGL